jgi:hypothetical protein
MLFRQVKGEQQKTLTLSHDAFCGAQLELGVGVITGVGKEPGNSKSLPPQPASNNPTSPQPMSQLTRIHMPSI